MIVASLLLTWACWPSSKYAVIFSRLSYCRRISFTTGNPATTISSARPRSRWPRPVLEQKIRRHVAAAEVFLHGHADQRPHLS